MLEIKNFDEFAEWVANKQRNCDELKEDNYNLERERLKETEVAAELQEQVFERDKLLAAVFEVVHDFNSGVSHGREVENFILYNRRLLELSDEYLKMNKGQTQ